LRRVASFLSVGLTVCLLGLAGGASAVRAHPRVEPTATQADAGTSLALSVLKGLGSFTADKNAGNGFGQFLMQLGLGDANAVKLDEIQATLKEINSKLDALQASVAELRGRVENLNCNRSQDRTAVAEAEIETAWKSFGKTVTDARAALGDRAQQKKLNDKLVASIDDEFRQSSPAGAVTLVHNSLVGTAGLSSMIADCGVAYQEASGNLITSELHDRVALLVDYWQTVEAQAAVMDIGLLVDKGEEADARDARQDAENHLAEESAKVKPSLGDTVLDRSTSLLWTRTAISIKYVNRAARTPAGWRLPNSTDLEALVKSGYGSMNGLGWFRKSTPFVIPDAAGTTPAILTAQVLTWLQGKPVYALDLGATSKSWIKVRQDQSCDALFINGPRADAADKYLYRS